MPVILATQEAEIRRKPAWANSSQDPILKIPITKKAGGVAEGEGPEFKPQYHKKKKKREGETDGCWWLTPVIPITWEAEIGTEL
jgi:hypothetical protein